MSDTENNKPRRGNSPGTHVYDGAQAHNRYAEKMEILLAWLWLWVFTSHHIVGLVLGIGESASKRTIKRAIDRGILQEVEGSGSPSRVVMLTQYGRSMASRVVADAPDVASMPYPEHPSRLNLKTVPHDLLVQHVCAELLDTTEFDDAVPARLLIHRKGGVATSGAHKIPDAGLSKGTDAHALELQESYESAERIERIFQQYAEPWGVSKSENPDWASVVYASTSPALLSHYKRIAAAPLREWTYSSYQKRWQLRGTGKGTRLNAAQLSRFSFRDFSAFSRHYYRGAF